MEQIRKLRSAIEILGGVDQGFTLRQLAVFLAVEPKKGTNRPEMMHTLRIDGGPMTRIVQKLEQLGLITVLPDPQSSMETRLFLSPLGIQLREKLVAL
jgi:DNA-binding MarR family transcriptional regulator